MSFVSHNGTFNGADQAALEALARRTGMNLPPAEFVAAIRRAFVASLQHQQSRAGADPRLECPSADIFRGAIERGRKLAPVRPTILVIGAGEGIPGRESGYAAAVTEEVFEGQCRITRMEWTGPDRAVVAGEYDLVVSHSLPHFLFDVGTFLNFVAACLGRSGGGYVMGSEPNGRFWANAEIANRMADKREAKRLSERLRAFLDPVKLVTTVKLRSSEDLPFDARVNAYLREHHQMREDLTFKEINRIADPYFPDELLGEYPQFGGNGFDWERELPGMLPGFRRDWIATARFLGKRNPRLLDSRWSEVHAELERRYPLDGNVFSALWWRDQA